MDHDIIKGSIRIDSEVQREIRKDVISHFLESDWRDECIKKYLKELCVICASTDNTVIKNFYTDINKFFKSDFKNRIYFLTDEWIKSNCGLSNFARSIGQDNGSYNHEAACAIEYLTELEGWILKDISDIDFSHGATIKINKINYTPQEVIIHIRTLNQKLSESLVWAASRNIEKCQSYVVNNVMYYSVIDLFEGYKSFAKVFGEVDVFDENGL